MAAIAPIVIQDAQNPAQDHTFAPARTQADYALFEDRSSGTYVGFNKLTYILKRPQGPSKGGQRNLKLTIKLETPKLEGTPANSGGVPPAPVVAYRPVAELNVTFPERSSLQDRKDLLALLRGVLWNVFTVDAFEKYELPY